ncbi:MULTISPECIES: SAM-dependent methyltransferase [unclassified Streptomyces]|uniref:SAM-dependent methyltransferase n=1 Tax=unclassified Streptomyces TaxID=2593676 RepID=UPI002E8049F7|nr:SAM-dependent methyltransferase [Streptomyces sp. NBC_00589]WTI37159.1 SAM-dependent methyltransferase [Streptomyces sp. NBC_00775]WUB29165.1 SAM-dependent methyltransferase [Streptomyces sp. NBC_00589]
MTSPRFDGSDGSDNSGGSDAQPWAIDTSKPHPARMYDYFLGGKDNYEADRAAAEQFIKVAPEVRDGVRANRRFMHRAVRHVVAEGGVRQILDVGTGLPTEPNVHQIAHAIAPGTRVVYVDNDPIVSAHATALMDGTGSTTAALTSVVLADLRDPRALLDHPEVRKAIDFGRPVALLLVAVVHFLSDAEDPDGIVATLRDALPTGSYLVLSHATGDIHEDRREDAASVYNKATATLNLRPHDRVQGFFGDFTLVAPGLVQVPDWRPDEPPGRDAPPIGIYGGVARKNG